MTGILNALIAGVSGAVKDAYFNLVSLLLPGNGTNGAQNNTFLDGSSNNFTITRNGNTTQGTFSPFSQTGWGNYFNGSSSILETSTSIFGTWSTANASTTTATIEAMVYVNALQSAPANAYLNPSIIAKGNTYLNFSVNSTGNIVLFHYDGSFRYITSSGTIQANTWNYVAVTITGGTATIYINGTSSGSGTWYGIQTGGLVAPTYIGQTPTGQYWNGYISNLRVSSTVRTIATPLVPYTNDGNTSLLTCQSNRFRDASTNGYTITASGSPSVTPFSPFAPTQSYSASAVGGSGYFDGNGDWLNPNATSANLALGSGDFTIEFWLNTSRGATRQYIFDFRNNGSTGSISPTTAPALIWGDDGADNNGNWLRYVSLSNGSIAASADLLGVTLSTISNQWNHIAVVRSSGTVYGYLNGVRKNSVADSTNFNVNCSVSIAAVFLGSANYLGNISDFRVVKGTAVYTGTTYTVPTAPLTAITNTQLLLNYTNAGVVDATAKNVLETVGTAQISNTTSKFPPTSIYLSGDGNYLTSRSSPVFSLNGDFTMEAWVYPINAGRSADAEKYGTIVSCAAVGVSNPEFSWFIRIVGGVVTEYFLNLNFTTVLQVTGLSVSLNAWHYFAVTRSGTGTGNLKLYIDGTLVGTSSGAVTQSATFTSAQTLMVGRNAGSTAYQNWLSGYFQDVRITPGYVRTVTTVPTAPFPVQ